MTTAFTQDVWSAARRSTEEAWTVSFSRIRFGLASIPVFTEYTSGRGRLAGVYKSYTSGEGRLEGVSVTISGRGGVIAPDFGHESWLMYSFFVIWAGQWDKCSTQLYSNQV